MIPSKPKRLCSRPGCKNVITVGSGGLCEEHQKERQRKIDSKRGSSHERGYNARWRKRRKMYLIENPLCVYCLKEKKEVFATEIDHKIPHKGNYNLFWDESNWQSLCKSCHSKKTAKEDGAFGNPISG